MRLRALLVAAASATALVLPLAGTSHAFACNDKLAPLACWAYGKACSTAGTCDLFE